MIRLGLVLLPPEREGPFVQETVETEGHPRDDGDRNRVTSPCQRLSHPGLCYQCNPTIPLSPRRGSTPPLCLPEIFPSPKGYLPAPVGTDLVESGLRRQIRSRRMGVGRSCGNYDLLDDWTYWAEWKRRLVR